MSNSEYFKHRLKVKKISAILVELIFLLAIYNLFPFGLKGISKIICYSLIGLVVVISIIVVISYVKKINIYTDEELNEITLELDNKIDKIFPYFGLYFTNEYVVCMGRFNPFRLFAVRLDKIKVVNTFTFYNHDFYKSEKKRDAKRKGKKETTLSVLLDFFRFSVKDDIYHPHSSNNSFRVFDLLTDNNLYRITKYHFMNKKMKKRIDEVVDYFSKRLPNINYK